MANRSYKNRTSGKPKASTPIQISIREILDAENDLDVKEEILVASYLDYKPDPELDPLTWRTSVITMNIGIPIHGWLAYTL